MSHQGRQVIVTGGTGALGSAVVGALIEAGATCYVPWRHEAEAERFDYREHDQVKLFGSIDLTDEKAVDRLFGEGSGVMGVGPRGGRLRDGPRGQNPQGRSDAPPRHEFGELLPSAVRMRSMP
jgi:NAD(P)-dependent dehydrogenase (short-subunit alcohol dehydrogenase family)